MKTIYYWRNVFFGTRTHELFWLQKQDISQIVPELMDLFWPKAEEQVLDFIAKGEILLQSTVLDADGDGDEDRVYRMSPLHRNRGAVPPWEQEEHRIFVSNSCVDVDFPDSDRPLIYYIFPTDLTRTDFGYLTGSGMDYNGLFLRQGQVFWAQRSTLLLPEETGIVGFSQVCDGL